MQDAIRRRMTENYRLSILLPLIQVNAKGSHSHTRARARRPRICTKLVHRLRTKRELFNECRSPSGGRRRPTFIQIKTEEEEGGVILYFDRHTLTPAHASVPIFHLTWIRRPAGRVRGRGCSCPRIRLVCISSRRLQEYRRRVV